MAGAQKNKWAVLFSTWRQIINSINLQEPEAVGVFGTLIRDFFIFKWLIQQGNNLQSHTLILHFLN